MIGEFFRTLPEAFSALWAFGNGWFGLIEMAVSFGMVAAFCLLAWWLHGKQEWLSALFGVMGLLVAMWWLLGIIPSAWVYFADSQKDLLADQIIPSAIVIGPLEVATNFYNVFRDSIVMVEGTVALGIGVVLAYAVQRRLPRGLAEGEQRGPTTGGYK